MEKQLSEIIDKKQSTREFLNFESNNIKNLSKTEVSVPVDSQASRANNDASVIDIEYEGSKSPENSDNKKSPALNSAVSVKAEPKDFDQNLPDTVKLLKTPQGSKCYLIGTVHFSVESQDDVSKVIQNVNPHIIVVELCQDRIAVLQYDEETILKEARELTFNKVLDVIKQNGFYKGLFYVLFLDWSARITKVLGLAPGGEFRRALLEAKNIPNCMIHLGDRPIKITLGRALSVLSWWHTVKLAWQLLTSKNDISREEVEKYKSQDSIESMMADLAKEYPALEQVFVKERDIFLTNSLQVACEPLYTSRGGMIPKRVVGIVGMGHVLGITKYWGKVEQSQIPPIMIIPPQSLSSKIMKTTFKVSLLVMVVYAGYKLVPVTTRAFSFLKSSAENFFK